MLDETMIGTLGVLRAFSQKYTMIVLLGSFTKRFL